MTKWKTLKSEKDYKAAVKRIDELIDAERTDAVFNELNLLAMLVEQYEEEFYPMPEASPLEILKFMMEMKEIKQQDLIPILGTKGNVSKILSGKAKIQLDDIQPLSVLLGIPMEALIPKEKTYPKHIEPFALHAEESVSKYGKALLGKPNSARRSKPTVVKKARKKVKN
jgi:HTH-type transcriptional regulator/antitoxin HigA